MSINKVIKIVAINGVVFGSILILIDLSLGKYLLHSPAFDIPASVVDYHTSYDTSLIESRKGSVRAVYSRDQEGYRPYKINLPNRGSVLTIGGSTTDQRYVDDNKTWQRILESKVNKKVINGGVDGQSTFGHVASLENWHAKTLAREQIYDIIFYIGVNDVRFAKGVNAAYGNRYDSPTLWEQFRSYLVRRSFFFGKLKELKLKLDIIRGGQSKSPDGVLQVGHGVKNPPFLDKSIASNIPMSSDSEIQEYKQLFKELLITSREYFPNARVHIVQQQDPKCLISGGRVYVRISPNFIAAISDYCSRLASIYQSQEEIINSSTGMEIFLIKMFIDNPVPDEGFYDGIHANTLGTRAIGEYLAMNVKLQNTAHLNNE